MTASATVYHNIWCTYRMCAIFFVHKNHFFLTPYFKNSIDIQIHTSQLITKKPNCHRPPLGQESHLYLLCSVNDSIIQPPVWTTSLQCRLTTFEFFSLALYAWNNLVYGTCCTWLDPALVFSMPPAFIQHHISWDLYTNGRIRRTLDMSNLSFNLGFSADSGKRV